ncbi:hypothetical protein MKQ68_05105 [Chitinophaga horti]|uniref:Uncharacterized protein n=1 Tax=Chitinophaga horti TaxID=2920382 RepID=A0ABY6J4B5_9BACT|nr:hypothetical protein [Chitinophaga horti]UYQ94467.1 hypothetical protein MKQ68_05105 [Chitinophaga horti]
MISRIVILMLLSLPAMAQSTTNRLNFKSGQSQMIGVYQGTIFVNGQRAHQFATDNIVYKSKRNKLVEDKNSVFLFIETLGEAGKKNRLNVFNIVFSRADSITSVVASDVKDFDRDGYLEFGGSEVATPHPSADSLYYLPAEFYEIKKGHVAFDAEYTQMIDNKVNGTYLVSPLNKNGQCCVAIPKKKKK